jgi:hypothetical protein
MKRLTPPTSPLNGAGHLDTYVKAKTTKFFGLATEITKIYDFLKIPKTNHRFIASMR